MQNQFGDSFSLESTIKHLMWQKLEEDGHEGEFARVFGEVSFFDTTGERSRFDLVAELYERDYLIGFEVKAEYPEHEGESEGMRGYLHQIQKYIDCHLVNELFLVAPKNVAEQFDRYLTNNYTIPDIDSRYTGAYIGITDYTIPKSLGIISMEIESPLTISVPEPIIIHTSEQTDRRGAPVLSKNEAWYGHILWKTLIKNYGNHVIPEVKLPTGDRIDFIVYSAIDNKIGFEVKYKLTRETVSQLTRYLDAKWIDKLYLAVPDSLKERAYDMVSDTPIDVLPIRESA